MRRGVLLLCLAACAKPGGHAVVGGLGTLLAGASATDLRVSPDGKYALYLADPKKPALKGVPPQMIVGLLYGVPTDGGSPRKLGTGVTNVPGGYFITPDSHWVLCLAGYNAAVQSGTLQLVDLTNPNATPIDLGPDVTYMLVSPDSKWLAFVQHGVLRVGSIFQGPYKEVAGEVENAHFSPDSRWLVFKRTLAAAGGLLVEAVAGNEPAKKLGEQVGDYAFSPDAKRLAFTTRSEVVHSTYDLSQASVPDFRVTKVAAGNGAFRYSPDGKWLARTEGQRPELLGDLFVGPADGSPGRKIGERVDEFDFAPNSSGIAALERYDQPGRSGTLTVAQLPGGEQADATHAAQAGKPVRLSIQVPNFEWSADGRFVAYVARFFKPIYSIDLMLYPVGEEKAFKVNPGVFGYEFSPKNDHLLFRTNCLREGRECDLFKLDLAKPKEPPQRVVQGLFNFRSSAEGNRLIVTYARRDTDAYDVALYDFNTTAGPKTLDQFVVKPALFASPDGSRVVYIEQHGDRAGVNVYQAQ